MTKEEKKEGQGFSVSRALLCVKKWSDVDSIRILYENSSHLFTVSHIRIHLELIIG